MPVVIISRPCHDESTNADRHSQATEYLEPYILVVAPPTAVPAATTLALTLAHAHAPSRRQSAGDRLVDEHRGGDGDVDGAQIGPELLLLHVVGTDLGHERGHHGDEGTGAKAVECRKGDAALSRGRADPDCEDEDDGE
ncbi:hypothetical protein NPX13_g9392 [Xylaria arbuscula]|uniref:Uncharacterized protein n=1 Tax=Xylaria arbuscula TaxID=114810 RepID=A0A9W8TJ35_9PEZI|nr:hypothetical protein NPX13_g9392 [Xylaria arbuscula]